MPKYYIESGELKTVVTFDGTAKEAFKQVLRNTDKCRLSTITTVSQTGFDSESTNVWIDTKSVIEELEQE